MKFATLTLLLLLSGCVKDFRPISLSEAADAATLDYIELAQRTAVATLLSCNTFKEQYPASYARILETNDTFRLILSVQEPDDICASAYQGHIFLYPKTWKFRAYGCYRGRVEKVIAHEFMHLLKMPKHGNYANYRDYELMDPIESMVRACFDDRGM